MDRIMEIVEYILSKIGALIVWLIRYLSQYDGFWWGVGLLGIYVAYKLYRFVWPRAKWSHRRRIKSAKKALDKLQGFSHPAQVFGYLRKVDPFVFEELLLTKLERLGYSIKRNSRYTGDGGVDGRAYDSEGQLILIQAKRYSSGVNASDIEQLVRQVNSNPNADMGWFVHTGKTPKRAYQIVSGQPVDIISGQRLINFIQQQTDN